MNEARSSSSEHAHQACPIPSDSPLVEKRLDGREHCHVEQERPEVTLVNE